MEYSSARYHIRSHIRVSWFLICEIVSVENHARDHTCGILAIPHVREDTFDFRRRFCSEPALESGAIPVGGSFRTCTDEISPFYECLIYSFAVVLVGVALRIPIDPLEHIRWGITVGVGRWLWALSNNESGRPLLRQQRERDSKTKRTYSLRG